MLRSIIRLTVVTITIQRKAVGIDINPATASHHVCAALRVRPVTTHVIDRNEAEVPLRPEFKGCGNAAVPPAALTHNRLWSNLPFIAVGIMAAIHGIDAQIGVTQTATGKQSCCDHCRIRSHVSISQKNMGHLSSPVDHNRSRGVPDEYYNGRGDGVNGSTSFDCRYASWSQEGPPSCSGPA